MCWQHSRVTCSQLLLSLLQTYLYHEIFEKIVFSDCSKKYLYIKIVFPNRKNNLMFKTAGLSPDLSNISRLTWKVLGIESCTFRSEIA